MKYFPLHCTLSRYDEKIWHEYKWKGVAVLDRIQRKVHGECGYYGHWDKNDEKSFTNQMEFSAASDIVHRLIELGFFDKDKYDKYKILTSAAIQKEYIRAFRGSGCLFMKEEYLCLSITELTKNVEILPENGGKSAKNASRAAGKNESVKPNVVSKDLLSENDKAALSRLQALFDEAGLKVECDMLIEELFAKRMIMAINESPWIKTPSQGRPLSWWYSPPLKGGDKRNKIDILMSGGYKAYKQAEKKGKEPAYSQHEYTKEQLDALFDDIDLVKF